jgi:alpha-ketoglutarate-dependent taurine dioxygenase
MSNLDQYAKLWDASTLDPKNLVVEVGRVGAMSDRAIHKMFELFNKYGVAIVQHAQAPEPVEELVDLGKLFGNSVVHDRADARGLVVVAELSGYSEFVGASCGPHLMHTGGTFMPWKDVPKIVLLQCEKAARVGGRSMISWGAAAYRYLQEKEPEALAMLTRPDVFAVKRSARGVGQFGNTGGVRKAIFDDTRLEDGRVWLTWRFDGEVKLDLVPDEAHEAFDKLLNFFNRSENQIDFHLEANQIMVLDNTSVVHARTAYQTGSGRKLNRLQLDGTKGDMVFGFPKPAKAQGVRGMRTEGTAWQDKASPAT